MALRVATKCAGRSKNSVRRVRKTDAKAASRGWCVRCRSLPPIWTFPRADRRMRRQSARASVRHHAVPPDIDAIRFPCAVELSLRAHDPKRSARFQLAPFTRRISENARIRWNDDALLAPFIFDDDDLPFHAL